MTRATATFVLDSFDVEPFKEPPATAERAANLTRARIMKTFQGEVAGHGIVEAVMAQCSVEGSAAYVGIERITGTVHGRAGSFVLQHCASADRGMQSASWLVVPDSADGELAGMVGTGEIVIDEDGGHTFHLDYELP